MLCATGCVLALSGVDFLESLPIGFDRATLVVWPEQLIEDVALARLEPQLLDRGADFV